MLPRRSCSCVPVLHVSRCQSLSCCLKNESLEPSKLPSSIKEEWCSTKSCPSARHTSQNHVYRPGIRHKLGVPWRQLFCVRGQWLCTQNPLFSRGLSPLPSLGPYHLEMSPHFAQVCVRGHCPRTQMVLLLAAFCL